MNIEHRNRFEWFPFYPLDFMNSPRVRCMTLGEKGAYFTLLCFAWKEPECGLTNNEEDLKILANWKTANPDDRWDRVMACFPKHPTLKKRVHNPRLYREWLRARELSGKRSQVAKTYWEQVKASRPVNPPLRPTKTISDRDAKGFTSLGSEIAQIADKHFPPV